MQATPAKRRAIGYSRISLIVDDSTSLARQRRDIETLAEREGLDLVDILVDEGKSGRKAREKADRAVAMLASGEVDALIVWKLDRLTRGGVGALVPLLDALDAREAAVKTGGTAPLFITTDGHRSDSPAWRIIAAVLAEVARAEVENTAARAASAVHYRRTVTHRFAGGASVPFGYASVPAPDGVGRVLVIDDDEAAIVREAAARILDEGWSPFRVARDLNARLIPTSKSPFRRALRKGEDTTDLDRGTWTRPTVKSLLTSHTLLGRQTHRGTLLKGDDGVPLTVWPPLLSLHDSDRLTRALASDGRDPRTHKRAARLLSGVAFCAHCDAKMHVTTSGGKPIYACPTGWNHHGDPADKCPSPKIDAARLEGHVEALVLGTMGHVAELRTERVTANPHAAAELLEVEAAMAETQIAMDADDADDSLFDRFRELRARRIILRREAGDVTEGLVPTGRTIREAWLADDDPEARRRVALSSLDHLTVSRAAFPSQSLDVRVRFYWHPSPDEAAVYTPAP
ncbi:serine integrase [Microbacterium phage Honk]|uniref:Serine integrase n=1 Tax=Microbacterium phage Honk TaxID=2836095 RepID=A0A8F3EAA4_9CAUD|nr:serine integrase [Microbacterium phage Honk]